MLDPVSLRAAERAFDVEESTDCCGSKAEVFILSLKYQQGSRWAWTYRSFQVISF